MKAKSIITMTMMAVSTAAISNELVITSEVAANHWKHEYIDQFKEAVYEKSNGGLNFISYPGAQLYSDSNALSALGTGSVHMVWPVSVRLEQLNQESGIISLPFVLSDEKMTNECYYDKTVAAVSDTVANNG